MSKKRLLSNILLGLVMSCLAQLEKSAVASPSGFPTGRKSSVIRSQSSNIRRADRMMKTIRPPVKAWQRQASVRPVLKPVVRPMAVAQPQSQPPVQVGTPPNQDEYMNRLGRDLFSD